MLIDEAQVVEQPKPFDLNWPRYCPELTFPPYRHIPGVTPHPTKSPNGHSYGLNEVLPSATAEPIAWSVNEAYLYGVDLYNFAYWWEAHEAWEGLWHVAEDDYRLFLQGLIQVCASLIKHQMRMIKPLQRLSIAGRTKLREVLRTSVASSGIYRGIKLGEFLDCLDAFFLPLFQCGVSENTYTDVTAKPLIFLHF